MFAEGTVKDGGVDFRNEAGAGLHVPVMAREVTDFLACGMREGLLVDGTAGVGGHLERLLAALPGMRFLAVDRDPAAVSILRSRFGSETRVTVAHSSYSRIPGILREMKMGTASAVLFDLGLSSLQLDDPERGFSYRSDGPLDMRFDGTSGVTAAHLVNSLPESQLADIIYRFGEEGRSRRIARAIVQSRPVNSSRQLAEAVESAVRGRAVKVLSRVFQALRIAVNGEMEELDSLLTGLSQWTETGSRIAFLTFHSLEDRRIKLLFRDDPAYVQHSPRWLVPGEEEMRLNSRARSARLRMGVRQ